MDPITTKEEGIELLRKATEQIPNLTYFGIGIYQRWHGRQKITEEEVKSAVKEGQKDLADHLDEIRDCADWIKRIVPITSINPRRDTYGYKHMVEHWRKAYIGNGSFIAAAVGLGFRFRQSGPNAFFNFSEKSLNALAKEVTDKP